MTHDISLDEFEDDDLSEITEITDERGMSLNCNGPDLKVSCLSTDLAPLRFNEMAVAAFAFITLAATNDLKPNLRNVTIQRILHRFPVTLYRRVSDSDNL